MSPLLSIFSKCALSPFCFQQLNFALPRLHMKLLDYHYTGAPYLLWLIGDDCCFASCLTPGTVSNV